MITGGAGGAITRSLKIGPGAGRIGLEIVVLDRGDQPAIGIVEEGLQVGAAMRLAHLARFRVRGDRDPV